MEEGGWYVPSLQFQFTQLTHMALNRKQFVCVEPGHVDGFERVAAGTTWIGGQVLSVIHEERRLHI